MTRKLPSLICVFVMATGCFLSVVAARKRPAAQPPTQQAPQAATLIINEYLADPPVGAAGDANGDGTRDSTQDEFIELVNNGAAPQPIGQFTISDATQMRFTFPAGKIIPPGESAVVFGGGTPTGSFGNAGANGLVFAVGGAGLSLNNGGDTITIKDNLAVTVATLTYGSSEGGAGQSITRSPDVTGGFVTHSTAAGSGGALFSPGARVNGAPFTTTDPVIASISPKGTIAGNGAVTIAVIGINFHGGAQVRVDGTAVFTALFSSTELSADIPISITDIPGVRSITVRDPGGAISNSVTFTVLSQIGINEYLADPPDGLAGDANGDGVRDSSQDEFVEIVNRTGAPIDVSGFSVSDADAQRFIFPAGSLLPAGEAAVIFGGGSPQSDFGNTRQNGLLFTAVLSLNNTGDTITLKNASNATAESVTFGSTDGNANQSINRNPDIAGIAFANHSSIPGSGGRLFSPGTLVTGAPFSVGPLITSIAPDNARLGDPPFDITVRGSGFEGSSRVLIDGLQVITAFIATDRLAGRVASSVLNASGAHPVQVRNEGGNRSNAVTFTVIPPPPSLQSITPRIVNVRAGAFTLFLAGTNFVSGAVVLIDGASVGTTFVTAQQLRGSVPSTVSDAAGTRGVTVRNPDGRESNTQPLEVVTPSSVVTSISPSSAVAGGPDVALIVRGSDFKPNATVFFDQTALITTIDSASQLSATVPASLISLPGVHAVSVQNPNDSPSNQAVFQVLPDSPVISSIDPPTVIEASSDLIVTVIGSKFQRGAIVRNVHATDRGAALDTTFVSAERLQARVPSSLLQRPGAVALAVENPDLGLSNTVLLKVLIRDPLIINEYLADPPEGPAGDANGDGTRSSSQDEFVELLNRTAEPFDISGYKISDADEVRHVFAAGTVVPPFEAVVVFGGGTPTGAFGNAAENRLVFKASTGGLSLNNGGDTIKLQDAQGRLVQEISFGAVEGGAGQSINRDPDGDGGTFGLHTNVAGDPRRLFSPGTKAAGETFTVKPSVLKIAPSSVRIGSLQFVVSITGSKFLPGAVVILGNTALSTTFRSDTLLEAQVPASLLTDGGFADLRVRNPKGELSGVLKLLIFDDPPVVSRITPQTSGTGAENLEVTITGFRFQRGASALVQGQAVVTRFISSTSLIAVVPAGFFLRVAEIPLVVLNADGNKSNALTLTVDNGPLITRLSRNKLKAGSGTLDLTVGGVAFKAGVVVFANDTPLGTTFVSEASLTARIPAEMTSQPGALILQARHPDGGRSNTVKLKVRE